MNNSTDHSLYTHMTREQVEIYAEASFKQARAAKAEAQLNRKALNWCFVAFLGMSALAAYNLLIINGVI